MGVCWVDKYKEHYARSQASPHVHVGTRQSAEWVTLGGILTWCFSTSSSPSQSPLTPPTPHSPTPHSLTPPPLTPPPLISPPLTPPPLTPLPITPPPLTPPPPFTPPPPPLTPPTHQSRILPHAEFVHVAATATVCIYILYSGKFYNWKIFKMELFIEGYAYVYL